MVWVVLMGNGAFWGGFGGHGFGSSVGLLYAWYSPNSSMHQPRLSHSPLPVPRASHYCTRPRDVTSQPLPLLARRLRGSYAATPDRPNLPSKPA